jgi:hypothetical protein
MAYELQEQLLDVDSDDETDTTASLHVDQYNSDEEREDDIFEEESKQEPTPAQVPMISGKSRLEALRTYLETNLGQSRFREAYSLLKLIDESDISQSNYEMYNKCLDQCITAEQRQEYLPLIHSLIYLESADKA